MEKIAKARVLVTRFPFESRFGGEELHTLALMEELDKRGYEAFFLGSCGVLLGEFAKRRFPTKQAWLARPPVTKAWLVKFSLLSPILFFWAGWLLWSARKRWKVNTLYSLSFGEKLMMTPWARLFGMRILWLEHARIGAWLTKNPWRFVYRLWSRWVTVVVTSRAMEPFVKKFAKKIAAISCGVIVEKPSPLPSPIRKFLEDGFAVGTVARLTVDKGVDKIAKLVHSKPDMRLIIVGEGPLESKLEKLRSSGRIMLVPSLPRAQLMALYRSLDLFILGSMEMDPFGMVAAEAMWFGTPVLMTNKCGISRDLVNGREAVVVGTKFAEIDKAVKKLKKHKAIRDKIGRRGQEFVKKEYPLRGMVDNFEALI